MSNLIVLNMTSYSVKYLCQKDKRLAKGISLVGAITYVPYEDSYEFLVGQIINQMLSNKVADVIYQRLVDLCEGHVSVEAVSKLTDEQIKSIGTANSKVSYIRSLTSLVENDQIDFDSLQNMSDSDAIKKLTSIRGIGIWSAKMYLIFVMDRPDVLPIEDVAFQQSYKWLYKTEDTSKIVIEKKCKKWKPYSSIAARYLYKLLDGGYTKTEFHLFKDIR